MDGDGDSPGEIEIALDMTKVPEQMEAGMKQLGELLNKELPRMLENAAKQIGQMNKSLGQLPQKMKRARLARQYGAEMMSEDSIMARRTGMALKAKKAETLGGDTRKRQPKFMCPEHRERLVFSKLNQLWECPSPGCTKTKLPEMDRTDTSIIKSKPRIIGKLDSDGDMHWYLNYVDENIMIELPFSQTDGMSVFVVGGEGRAIALTITTDNVALFNSEGKQVGITTMTASD